MKLIALILLILSPLVYAQEREQQPKRLALVIGNATYKHGGSLKNPVNDANLMARTLEDLDFDVIKETDAELKEMQNAFKVFVNRLEEYDVALFFYAGHGLQIGGQNYLIPIDAELEDRLSIEFDAFNVSSINKYFAINDEKLNIMILDACRNNPYRAWMRGGGQGFNAIQDQGAGTIIAFATREGETASDGKGNNGLFTKHLVEQMRIPQNITEVFQNTRVSVMEESKKQQVPQEWNMLTGNFYFTSRTTQQSALEADTPTEDPVLVSGKVAIDYGSIMIDTEIGGELYLDEKKLGDLQANSTGNELPKIKVGTHTLKIVGSETQSREIIVNKNSITRINFKEEAKEIENNAGTSFTDSRDSKKYKSVRIGDQVWMAENLDHLIPNSYVNKKGDRVYKWDAAMKACPAGWHLPSDNEWLILLNQFGGALKAGAALKSQSGWYAGYATNSSGFTGLPAGFRDYFSAFSKVEKSGFFWSSTEKGKKVALARILFYKNSKVDGHYYDKDYALSCRCVQD